MKQSRFILTGLLVLFALFLFWWGNELRVDAGVQCSTPGTLFNTVTSSVSSAQCYQLQVPINTRFLRIKLVPSSGAFDLYHNQTVVSYLSYWDRVNSGSITNEVVYAILEPRSGTHTIVVAPQQNNGRFKLDVTAVPAASAASSNQSVSCGEGCRVSQMVIAQEGIVLGPNFGDRVILPIEIDRPGRIEVEATWSGSAQELALILNGPDRPGTVNPVAYYAREDGRSPLRLVYNVSEADFRRGRKWRVSLVNFSGGFATGNIKITYPADQVRKEVDTSAGIVDFVGRWENVDPNTRGITAIEIDRSGNALSVHSWGACVPTDCDHGTQDVPFEGNPVEVYRDFSFVQEILTLWRMEDGTLRTLSDNVFTDGTNRDYVDEYYFHRVARAPATNSISNLQINWVSDTELEFTVDYSYNADHGDDVWLGAYPLRNDEELSWFGYGPSHATQGDGHATIRLTYAYNNPPDSITTDQIEVFMYVGGSSPFYSQRFDYRKTWLLTPPDEPTPTPIPALPTTSINCEATVNTDSLNLRAGPGQNYAVLGKYPFGVKLRIIESPLNSNWVKVSTIAGDAVGWMHRGYLLLSPCGSPPVAQPSDSESEQPVLEWITVPAGDFIMGSSDDELQRTLAECNVVQGNCELGWFDQEYPDHQVYLEAFEINQFEITNAQYNQCVQAGRCNSAGRAITDSNIAYNPIFFADDHPVVGISFYDASDFCVWMNARLPSEAEWEKAARGRDGRRYSWGNEFDPRKANLSGSATQPVGSYPDGSSPYEVMDMIGNAFEWTSTAIDGKYMLRGGSWFTPRYRGRTSDRGTSLQPTFANYDIGFRCAR